VSSFRFGPGDGIGCLGPRALADHLGTFVGAYRLAKSGNSGTAESAGFRLEFLLAHLALAANASARGASQVRPGRVKSFVLLPSRPRTRRGGTSPWPPTMARFGASVNIRYTSSCGSIKRPVSSCIAPPSPEVRSIGRVRGIGSSPAHPSDGFFIVKSRTPRNSPGREWNGPGVGVFCFSLRST